MVFWTVGIYVITSTFFLRFLIQKVMTFYVFCRVSYVFSKYGRQPEGKKGTEVWPAQVHGLMVNTLEC